MHVVADTEALVTDGVILPDAARIIEARSRETMVSLAINGLLCLGILFATFGLIFWLADALAVAVTGLILLGGGLSILARSGDLYRMFGNTAALIGSGMLIGGAAVELLENYPSIAGWTMAGAGIVVAALAGRALLYTGLTARFVAGSIFLMGVALHMTGASYLLFEAEALTGLPKAAFMLYLAAVLAGAGWMTDVRLVTALAIAPFAQMLDTGTAYFHAAYVFYSPEPTLTILQMAVLIGGLLWLAPGLAERTARHGRILAVLAFVVANLSALVGSLWGDTIGLTIWGPEAWSWNTSTYDDWEAYDTARAAFEATALQISPAVFSILWAVALAAMVVWSAHRNNRGLFNAAMTFAAIHGYTQFFESFWDEPLAYVVGGFAAIPLAWGIWRLNRQFLSRAEPA